MRASIPRQKSLIFQTEALAFPGRSIATADYKTYGPVTKIGRESIYADMSITFMLTQDMAIREYFDRWLNLIQNDTTYDPNYIDDYAGDIYIGQLSADDQERLLAGASGAQFFTYAQKIEDAFPTSVGDVTLGHAENNTYGKLLVNFTYRRSINLNLQTN